MDTLREILAEVNSDPAKIKKHAANNYLRNFFEVALIPSNKLKLPEGLPKDVKFSGIESDVQTKGVMWQFLKKVKVLCDENIKVLRREVMFIDALESVTKQEAAVLVAMKEQTLHLLYPNLTFERMKEHGYFN